VFSVYTTNLKVKKFYFLATEYLFVLYVSQRKPFMFFLYNTQRLVFITEDTSVYSAVRTGSLTKMLFFHFFHSYRAVKTLSLVFKTQTINSAYRNNSCLFWYNYRNKQIQSVGQNVELKIFNLVIHEKQVKI